MPDDPNEPEGSRLRALIFDVDGTLADTEEAHRLAFNQAFAKDGLPWSWDRPLYRRLLNVAGGKERILHYWGGVDPGAVCSGEAVKVVASLHAAKTRIYEADVSSGRLPLRPGVRRLMEEAHAAGLKLAIATTTTPANIDALLRPALGAHWSSLFAYIGDAVTAPRKKPDPQVYEMVLSALRLAADECIAFEDSAHGLHAAQAAGIRTIVTPSPWTTGQDFGGALRVLPHLGDPSDPLPPGIDGISLGWLDLATLRAWHRETLRA